MSKLMTGQQLADKALNIAKNYKTLYVWGGFGAPLNKANKERYTGPNAAEYNRLADRKALILAADPDTFAFDCVGLIKGILWGWNGDLARTYGGAVYASNGVPDIDANAMIGKCSDVSTSFSLDQMSVGEAVWKKGHIGIYIGNGLAVECTPSWYDKVQVTACNCDRVGYNRRNWTKHGKLPCIDYSAPGMPFVDVPKDAYYRNAVEWAWENGIASDTNFHTYLLSNEKMQIDGVDKQFTPVSSGDTGNRTIRLFAEARGSNVSWNACKQKINYARIKQNGVLTSELIPCYHKTTLEIGFYDTVKKSFVTKTGSGTVTKGPDVT